MSHPVYWNPQSESLQPFIDLKKQYPDVPMTLVFNPFNGVGTARVDWYAEEIKKCKRAGIKVYGYIYTEWDARSQTQVETEIRCYKKWYCCQGIFFDELSSGTNPPTYVTAIDAYSKEPIRDMMTMGNPGTSVASNYIGIMDSYVVYEGAGLSDMSWIPTSYPSVDKSNFVGAFYSVATLTNENIEDLAEYLGTIFITNHDNFLTASDYIEQIVEVLDTIPG